MGEKTKRLIRIVLAPGVQAPRIEPVPVTEYDPTGANLEYAEEGRRLADFLYWGAPWRFFDGLQERLNELKQAGTDQYSRPPIQH